MFDMIGEFGIFGDALMPVMKEQNKEAKTKDEKKSEKKEEKKENVKKYKAPLTIVFDSMESLEIKGDEEYTRYAKSTCLLTAILIGTKLTQQTCHTLSNLTTGI